MDQVWTVMVARRARGPAGRARDAGSAFETAGDTPLPPGTGRAAGWAGGVAAYGV